jgi:predicted ATPase/class 3 adenylate cyclase
VPEHATPREAPAAERRLVSVLFADLVGFTALSESRDAEEVRELLSRYFDTCRRLIGLYGGTVEKFIGDAVMAVWGTPTATEDDAERAVRAALDLVAAVSALGQELGAEDLRARAGVLTGEAAVTIGAEGEGMVAGDLVNTASRIQSVAEPGAVFVGDSTRRATEPAIVYQDAGAFELKGKEGLTPLWKALRVVSGVRGTLKSQGLEAPFVGRDRELRQVKDLFHACADEKKAHLVSVTGIGGIGKSRLSWEFYKYFDGLAQLVYWHRGRCLAYGEGVTYWALADMVRMRCRIAEDEPPGSALAKLRSTLEEHILDPDERRFVEPRLAQLLGLGEHESPDRQDLFAAWRLFFERLADAYPTVLAFEDVQWADASLLDFIEYLLEWSRNHPLYVITLARPELLERRPTWGAGHRNFTSLYLEPLSGEAMEALLTGLVPGLPAGLREQILARAEGVPLYAVETVRMLLDRGALVQEGSVYRPVGTIEALEVPETLHALIAARLDGLPHEERRLLQDGSVLGKTFTRAALAVVAGLAEADLDPLLHSLVRKEVLSLQSDPRSPEHGQYGFLQDLVRHVAYETLSKRERRTRHLAAAQHLSSALTEEEVTEVVASHLVEAYRLDPDAEDATEIKERARLSLVSAGDRAGSLGAAAEAQRYFEQAAELSDDPKSRAELFERAGQSAVAGARLEQARTHFEQAIELFGSAGLAYPSARVSARLGEVDFAAGYLDRAVERLEQAFQVFATDHPDPDVAMLAAQLGRFHYLKGEWELGRERIEVAIDMAERLVLPEVLAQAFTTFGAITGQRGRPHQGRALAALGLQIALDRNLSAAALRAYNNLGWALQNQDRYSQALELYEQGMSLARKVGDRFWGAQLSAVSIPLLVYLGRWSEAVAVGEEIRAAADSTLLERVRAELLALVNPYLQQGQSEKADEMLTFSGARESQDPQVAAVYACAQAAKLRSDGRYAEALAEARKAIATHAEFSWLSMDVKEGLIEAIEAALASGNTAAAEELLATIDNLLPGERTPYLEAHAHRFRARLAHNPAEADASYAVAATLMRELELPFHLAITQLEQAERLVARDRSEEAESLLSEARLIFERLEAEPWLQRAAQLSLVGRELEPMTGRP